MSSSMLLTVGEPVRAITHTWFMCHVIHEAFTLKTQTYNDGNLCRSVTGIYTAKITLTLSQQIETYFG